jgi:hypothetical protein
VYSHTDADGKRHYESITGFDYNKVLLEVAQFKADKKREKIDSSTHELTLGEAMRQYLDDKKAVLSPATYKGYTSISRTHFLDLQRISIHAITPQQIQRAVDGNAADGNGPFQQQADIFFCPFYSGDDVFFCKISFLHIEAGHHFFNAFNRYILK